MQQQPRFENSVRESALGTPTKRRTTHTHTRINREQRPAGAGSLNSEKYPSPVILAGRVRENFF